MILSESNTTTVEPDEELQSCCCSTPTLLASHHERADDHHHTHSCHDKSHGQHGVGHEAASLNRTAFTGTLPWLTGCTIGEVLGMATTLIFYP